MHESLRLNGRGRFMDGPWSPRRGQRYQGVGCWPRRSKTIPSTQTSCYHPRPKKNETTKYSTPGSWPTLPAGTRRNLASTGRSGHTRGTTAGQIVQWLSVGRSALVLSCPHAPEQGVHGR